MNPEEPVMDAQPVEEEIQEIPIEEGAPSTKAYVKIFHNPAGVLTINEKIDKYR